MTTSQDGHTTVRSDREMRSIKLNDVLIAGQQARAEGRNDPHPIVTLDAMADDHGDTPTPDQLEQLARSLAINGSGGRWAKPGSGAERALHPELGA